MPRRTVVEFDPDSDGNPDAEGILGTAFRVRGFARMKARARTGEAIYVSSGAEGFVFQVVKPRTWQGALRGQGQIKGDLLSLGVEWETSRTGTVSRRGAEAQGRPDVVPVALVVVNPTFIPSHPRGFARTRLKPVNASREVARTRRGGRGGTVPVAHSSGFRVEQPARSQNLIPASAES